MWSFANKLINFPDSYQLCVQPSITFKYMMHNFTWQNCLFCDEQLRQFVTQFYKTVNVRTFFKIYFIGFLFFTGKDESVYQVIA